MKTVERILNGLASRIEPAFLEQLLEMSADALTEQRKYRITFPVYANKPTLYWMVSLLVKADNPHIRLLLQNNGFKLVANPPAEYIFLCNAYDNEEAFLKSARQLTRFFPEQSDAPENIITK